MDIVLVGGQAINLWALFYLDRVEALRNEGPFTSKDVDFLGDRAAVQECAKRLPNAKALLEGFDREGPVNSGVVEFVDEFGVERRLDLLWSVLGVNDHELREAAVRVQFDGVDMKVMNPVHCVFGRGPLILRMNRTDPHTMTQLRASVVCAREFISDLVRAGEPRKALRWNERIFDYSRTNDGLLLFERHGIDTFKAVLVDGLPAQFRERRHPQMCEILAARRARQMNTPRIPSR